MFTCICGYRERLSDFEKQRKSGGTQTRATIRKYLERQQKEQASRGNSALADQLAKWKAQQEEDE